MYSKNRPIILIHGLWNNSSIFNSIKLKLDYYGVEYFAPTLIQNLGTKSILKITKSLDQLILERFGLTKEIDILGFSMGGIIGRCWIKKFEGYKRTKRFFSIGSPHKGTFAAQIIPRYPFKGISELKIKSNFLKDLSKNNFLLNNIECVSFYTYWDAMVIPGFKAHLPLGKKVPLKVFNHKNLVKHPTAVNKIIKSIVN